MAYPRRKCGHLYRRKDEYPPGLHSFASLRRLCLTDLQPLGEDQPIAFVITSANKRRLLESLGPIYRDRVGAGSGFVAADDPDDQVVITGSYHRTGVGKSIVKRARRIVADYLLRTAIQRIPDVAVHRFFHRVNL